MQTWPAYDGSAVDNPQPPSDGAHVHDHEQLMDAEPVLANGIAAINAVLDCASTSAGEAFPGEIAFPHQPASRTHPGHGAPLEEIASLPIVSSPPRITLTIPPACPNNVSAWTGFLLHEGIDRVRTWACGAVRHCWPVSTPSVSMPALPRHLHLMSDRGRVCLSGVERTMMRSEQCVVVRFISVDTHGETLWMSYFRELAKEEVKILFDVPSGTGQRLIFALAHPQAPYSMFGVSFFAAFLPYVN